MSERDLKRVEVLNDVLAGLGAQSCRQPRCGSYVSDRPFDCEERYEEGGGGALVHSGSEDVHRNRQWNSGIREYAVELVRS